MFECVEHPDKLHAFEELLKPYGIKEAVRTGRVALRKTTVEPRPPAPHARPGLSFLIDRSRPPLPERAAGCAAFATPRRAARTRR